MASLSPSNSFDPRSDAESLKEAMGNTFHRDNYAAIIEILTSRKHEQRVDIASHYKTMYGESLAEAFKGHLLNKGFWRVAAALVTPKEEFYAKELHKAMAGLGTCEATMIEIICSLNSGSIRILRNTYKELYGRSLEEDVKDDSSSHLRRLLLSLIQGKRDEGCEVNKDQVSADVDNLFQNGEGRWGTDESVFNKLMVNRSYGHLREVFKAYARKYGTEIEDVIQSEFSGDIKEAHLAIVKRAKCRSAYYAERLFLSMKSLGTDDRTLIRVIVGRSGIDLAEIKRKFNEKYQETKGTLDEWVADDTSGVYKDILLKILETEDK